MRFLDGKSIGVFSFSLMLAMAGVGCGDDDSAANDAGPDSGLSDGGNAGSGGSKDSGTDSGMTGTGGSTSSGGTGGAGGLMGAMCDSTIDKTATCGGMACAASTSMFAGAVCSVPCCLPDDTCGFRRAVMDMVTDCAGPAVPDPNCPDMAMGGAGAGMNTTDAGADASTAGGYQGCCAPSGHCGIISPTDMLCITSSPLIMGLMPGAACGEGNDGGSNDGG